jgi:hypothetical protein
MQTIHKAGEFDYTISSDQLAFLQALSSNASQQLTLRCQNVAVVNVDSAKKTSKHTSIRLLSDDDVQFHAPNPHGSRKHIYGVLSDGCQQMSSEAATTVQVISKAGHLPIRDIGAAAMTDSSQKLGVEIGEVCYS